MRIEYTCARCGGTFLSDRPDEEATAEYEKEFPADIRGADFRVRVCHECYLEMTEAYPIAEFVSDRRRRPR